MSGQSPITTHVLDTAAGCPAPGVEVRLERQGDQVGWTPLAAGHTNREGRLNDLLPPGSLEPGRYRLEFATGDYFSRWSIDAFYPRICVEFQITAADEHYHVPLLVSPFGYTTYRGS